GFTIRGEETKSVDMESLCSALGVESVKKVDPYDLTELKSVLVEEINRPESSVIIAEAPCVLHRRREKSSEKPFLIEEETCMGCKTCLQIGCPAIEWQEGENGKGKARINCPLCTGCAVCAQLCKKSAIQRKDE
ncbi:MAG: indolepyruvate ferredoxin oxidoreductase subunit alpha, partial [Thermodesulfobacteriota bacterium]|nr:indolepyruvate ferredoxin oxidoreductase subunit alpha [Thermodesulfobacteriota bacterium]